MKIIHGEIPSYKIFEDEHTYVFLDIYPKQTGHTLVIPKVEVGSFEELEEPFATNLWNTSRYIARTLKNVYQSKKVGVIIEGLEVEHAHVHLIPINQPGDLHAQAKNFSEVEMREIQQQIINQL